MTALRFCVLGICLTACGAGDDPGPEQDTPLVVREVLRLGIRDGSGPELFDQVTAAALDEHGNVFVGNNGSGTIRVFGPAGEFKSEIGGRGEGPQEVGTISSVRVWGDSLIIVDRGRARKMVLFDLNGDHLDTFPLRTPGGRRLDPICPVGEGWLVWVYSDESALAPGADSLTRYKEARIVDLEAGTLGPVLLQVPTSVLYHNQSTGTDQSDPSLFRREWHTGADGTPRVFVVQPAEYRVDVFDLGGLLVNSIRREVDRRPILDEDVAEVHSYAMQIVDTISRGPRPIPPQMRQRQKDIIAEEIKTRAVLPRPSHFSPLGSIQVSQDGSFWVLRLNASDVAKGMARWMFTGVASGYDARTHWDLHDAMGRFLGTTELPSGFRPMAVEGRDIVGVLRGDLDVEYVVLLRASELSGA